LADSDHLLIWRLFRLRCWPIFTKNQYLRYFQFLAPQQVPLAMGIRNTVRPFIDSLFDIICLFSFIAKFCRFFPSLLQFYINSTTLELWQMPKVTDIWRNSPIV
jgi:hypothetical protein